MLQPSGQRAGTAHCADSRQLRRGPSMASVELRLRPNVPLALGARGTRLQSTARLWQDLERALSARRLALRAVRRARKRRARWPRLARLLGADVSGAALSRRRKRNWRTTPSKSSATLCCSVADVSMNLQSNTTAQARPSEGRGQAGQVEGDIKVGRVVFSLKLSAFSFGPTMCWVPGESEINETWL